MEIKNKFVYVKHKSDFEPLISGIPENLKPIVFIEDSKEIWTCGTYFSVGYPSLVVSDSGSSVLVSLGDADLSLITSGESLSIKKGTGNSIVLSSNALTKITTSDPLQWVDNKLSHKVSGVTAGSYGPSDNLDTVNILTIPSLKINDTGHVIEAYTKNLKIRDYVDQLAPTEKSVDRNILLSYNQVNGYDDTQATRKANGLTYNDSTGTLAVKGGIQAKAASTIDGDLTVTNGVIIGNIKGNVEGVAVPKVHLSTKPEYGGASTKMYGHVLVQDGVPATKPDASSDNVDATNTGVIAIAASPLMVWNAMEAIRDEMATNGIKVTTQDTNGNTKDVSDEFIFSDDFEADNDNKIYIKWTEI